MAYPATSIAFAFVKKGIEEGHPITQMQLQKMVYLAHGYHIAKFEGKPLIEEVFQAWKFGPVVPSIYGAYKAYGSDLITKTDKIINPPSDVDIASLSSSAITSIDYTWKITKNLTAKNLSDWSHSEGSPWEEVYKEDELSIPISNESIKQYFVKFLSPEIILAS